MRFVRVSAILFLASAASLLPTTAAAQTAVQTSSDRQIHQWMDNFKHAFEARDTKAVMALYAPDIVAYDVTPPLQYVGNDSYTHDFATYFAGYKGPMHLEFRDCHISASGDVAIFFCLLHVNGTLTSGNPVTIWLRNTTALRRVNGRWLDFHDHISVPADMQTGKALVDLHP
jgi:ketosteroid isomerase-like protein